MLISVSEFFGRFHPLLVHLPIGVLLIGLLLQWIAAKEKYTNLQHSVPFIILIGAIAAILSCISGYFLSLSGEYDESTVNWHMWMGIAVAVIAIVLYLRLIKKKIDRSYKVLSVGLFFLVSFTGHLGGSLTHGSDYLTSAFANSDGSSKTSQKVIPDVQQAFAYADIIQPMLQDKCYSCHGPSKQKGKLRMDTPELLMKGGKEGVEIIPGKADESELIKRLLLPREDKHHMAPKEKPQLTEKQVALLHWWIEQGADFNKLVKDMAQPEKIKPVLLALQAGHEEIKAVPNVPVEPVEKADQAAIQKLKDAGIVIIPVAQNSNYLSVNFVTAPDAGDKEVSLLMPLKKQLAWLKLGNSKITDSAALVIGQCTNLTQLHLNNTSITDKGLEALKTISNLQSLNLVGTKVTAKGVQVLKDLKALQTVYLYQTNIEENDWEQLKKIFTKTILDSGGYIVPILISDTTEVK